MTMREREISSLSDNALMREVSNGDLDQLGILFDRYHSKLRAFFIRMTGSPALSEDLVQEVFLRILKYRRTFRPDSRFSTWMYQIARNARIDQGRRNPTSFRPLDEGGNLSVLSIPAPDESRRAETEMLGRALADLPPEKRELLVLARFQGLKHQEIGEVLGCSANTVKVRVFRAVQELRDIYLKMTGEKCYGMRTGR